MTRISPVLVNARLWDNVYLGENPEKFRFKFCQTFANLTTIKVIKV
jgi:hypothetical protein